MNLGFIESKTYDEISIGDTASTEHVLTIDDAMAFASISGFHSMLNADELIQRVPRRNHTVRSLPAFRAPASTRKPQVQRGIESTAINSGLTSGQHAGQHDL